MQLNSFYSFIKGKAVRSKIEISGEQIVSDYLRSKGFNANPVEDIPGTIGLAVTGKPSNFIVNIKPVTNPKTPVITKAEEENAIKQKAAQLGFEAWEAKVVLDRKLQLKGEIEWRRIS